MVDWAKNEELSAEIATATHPRSMMRFEAIAQHFASKNTLGDSKYSGGSWQLDKCEIEEVGTGYYFMLQTKQTEFTVNCAGIMTTVAMTPRALSFAVSLHAANMLNMEAFQVSDSKSNKFWHDCYFAIYEKAREVLDEVELSNLAMYLD